MPTPVKASFRQFRAWLRIALSGPQLLAFLPALTLAAFWFGGEGALLMIALVMPIIFALAGLYSEPYGATRHAEEDRLTGLALEEQFISTLDGFLVASDQGTRRTAVLAVEIDEFDTLVERYGRGTCDELLLQMSDRIAGVVRQSDCVARLDGPVFAIALAPAGRADLEAMIQLSARIQAAVAEPVSLDRTGIYATCSIGFCLEARAPERQGATLLEAARTALGVARSVGHGAIRSFAPEMQVAMSEPVGSADDLAAALDAGEIRPFFQPQISTDTGEVTGFEALARWIHPERGVLAPVDFLPAIEANGLYERLGEVMLYHALTALKSWHRTGHAVPGVSVNFASQELRNPRLLEKIRWELDRFDLAPEQLTVEILETVIAETEDDTIIRNVAALSEFGCRIDLDDFGTGPASLANIRRYTVDRIKIDRSFVTRIDHDQEQQAMLSAILTMAERLKIETLGEGVETVGEHAMLAQLGCAHVQGFGIARPMPFEETLDWIERHRAKLTQTPQVGRSAG